MFCESLQRRNKLNVWSESDLIVNFDLNTSKTTDTINELGSDVSDWMNGDESESECVFNFNIIQ